MPCTFAVVFIDDNVIIINNHDLIIFYQVVKNNVGTWTMMFRLKDETVCCLKKNCALFTMICMYLSVLK